ncbi:LysE family translocator [Marinobacter xestospongiae]
MSLMDCVSLFAVLVALAALPSTSVVLVVSRAAEGGLRAGAAVTAGIVLGDLVFVALALGGMAVLAQTLGGLFLVVRWLAGLWLIWLGIQLWRRPSADPAPVSPPSRRGLAGGVLAGLALTLADLKAIVFYASLLPLFVDLAQLTPRDLVLVVVIDIVAVGGVKLIYASAALRIARRLGPKPGLRRVAAGAMVTAGGWLLVRS